MHYAVSNNTAAEIVYNSKKDNIGLTNFKGDMPTRKETEIAKNYLNSEELQILNRLVSAYLDIAEINALKRKTMTMQDWIEKLNVFLQFNGKEILHNAGKIFAKVAQELAYREYDKFKVKQDKLYKSDFDLLLEEIDK